MTIDLERPADVIEKTNKQFRRKLFFVELVKLNKI
jgi:hypothetical protein